MSLGETLRSTRIQKGFTLAQVAENTHLLMQIVENLENEDFRRIAAPIYGRGFVRLYAEFLGLDPEPLIREFTVLYDGTKPPVVRTKKPAVVITSPAAKPAVPPQSETDSAGLPKTHPDSRPMTSIPPRKGPVSPQPSVTTPAFPVKLRVKHETTPTGKIPEIRIVPTQPPRPVLHEQEEVAAPLWAPDAAPPQEEITPPQREERFRSPETEPSPQEALGPPPEKETPSAKKDYRDLPLPEWQGAETPPPPVEPDLFHPPAPEASTDSETCRTKEKEISHPKPRFKPSKRNAATRAARQAHTRAFFASRFSKVVSVSAFMWRHRVLPHRRGLCMAVALLVAAAVLIAGVRTLFRMTEKQVVDAEARLVEKCDPPPDLYAD